MRAILGLGMALWAGAGSIAMADENKISRIHADIIQDYPSVQHENNQQISEWIKTPRNDLMIFDVRKPNEYAVSHLDGAVRLDPGMTPSDFLTQYGADIKGKTLVFYCSVGRRSSHMIDQLEPTLSALDPDAVYNLEGGIFSWHNKALPLSRGDDATEQVHPYNWIWGRSLERQDHIAYRPE